MLRNISFYRPKTTHDWKNQTPNSQPCQSTSAAVPECDSNWGNSSTTTTTAGHQSSQSTQSQSTQPDFTHTGSVHPPKKKSINETMQQLDEAQLVQIATEAFVKELGLEDDNVLKDGKIQLKEVPAGTYLMKEESHKVCD